MKYALEVLQGHMVCGAREGRAAVALTKWSLAPKWQPLGSRRDFGWGDRAGISSGVRMDKRERLNLGFSSLSTFQEAACSWRWSTSSSYPTC